MMHLKPWNIKMSSNVNIQDEPYFISIWVSEYLIQRHARLLSERWSRNTNCPISLLLRHFPYVQSMDISMENMITVQNVTLRSAICERNLILNFDLTTPVQKNNFLLMSSTSSQSSDLASQRTKCEIYTRVMGYYRPVSQFNHGKKAEFYSRTCFEETKSLNSQFMKQYQ